jgi:putative ABC transport system substrate-binding protein
MGCLIAMCYLQWLACSQARGSEMRRRDFITAVGGAAAVWPLAAHAQQPGIPVIGFLDPTSPEALKGGLSEFRRGLKDAGYIEGQNVAIEFRWGNGQPIMRQLASELVRLQVAVIVASGGVDSQRAAKAATSTIPIVMMGGADPVKYGLVDSLSRPGGNITGVTRLLNELAGKWLDLLLKLAPQATTVGYLVAGQVNEVQRGDTDALLAAARSLGRQIMVLECRDLSDFDKAFGTMIEHQAGGVVVSAFPLAFNNREKIVALAAHHKIPAVYAQSQYVSDGGLMSYSATGLPRQVAIRYVARILKGARPVDLPIEQPTNFRLIINLKTAKALGLEIPPTFLALADAVIE